MIRKIQSFIISEERSFNLEHPRRKIDGKKVVTKTRLNSFTDKFISLSQGEMGFEKVYR